MLSKSLLKKGFARLEALASSADAAFSAYEIDGVIRRLAVLGSPLVLSLHDVSGNPSPFLGQNYLTITPRRLAGLLDYLSEYCDFIHPCEFSEVTGALSATADKSKIPLMLTFDDGFGSIAEVVKDLLSARSIVPLVFINSEPIQGRRPLVSSYVMYLNQRRISRLSHLNVVPEVFEGLVSSFYSNVSCDFASYQGELIKFQALKKLVSSGQIVLANHLSNHWNAVAQDDTSLIDAFAECESFIVSLQGFSLGLFSYPNGQPDICFSSCTYEVLRKAGALVQFANAGYLGSSSGDWVLPRIPVTPWETPLSISNKVRNIMAIS